MTHAHKRTQDTHAHTSPVLPSLDFLIDVPDVSHHGVGTSMQGRGGQSQLGVELLHVGGLGDGWQRVGASAQQEVTEGGLNGGHVWREEGVLHLGWKIEDFNTSVLKFNSRLSRKPESFF